MNWHTFFFLLFALVACGFAVMVVLSSNIVRMALYLIFSLGATAGLFFLSGADFVGAMQLMIYVGGTLVLLVFGVMLTAQGPFVSMKTRGGDWILAALLSGSLLVFLVPAAFSVREWTNAPPTAHDKEDGHVGNALRGVPRTGNRESIVLHGTPQRAFATDKGEINARPNGKVRFASAASEIMESDAMTADQPTAALPGMATQPATATRLGMGLLGVRVDKLEGRSPELQRGMAGYLLPFEIVSVHLLVVLVGAAYLARTKRRATR